MTQLDTFFRHLYAFGCTSNGIVDKDIWTVGSWANTIEELILQVDNTKQQYFHVMTHNPEKASKRANKNSANEFQFLWADVDTNLKECKVRGAEYPDREEAIETLLNLPTPASILVDSGRGIHAYWLLDQAYGADQLPHHFMEYLKSHIGQVDEKKFNKAKLLRVPETLNSTRSSPVEIIHFDPEIRYTLEEIEAVVDREVPSFEVLKTPNPIDATGLFERDYQPSAVTYNDMTIKEMLVGHGYVQVSADRWLSPYSASGSAGVWVDHENNRLHCHHMCIFRSIRPPNPI